MTIQLCVLLWARPGAGQALIAYEDRVLALLGEHRGRLVQRARTDGAGDSPAEIQLITFPDQESYDGFIYDERRTALAPQRDAAIERTEIYPVSLI